MCLIAVFGDRVGVAADQPQWGQAWTRNQVSAERGLPDSFDPKSNQNIKWVAQLGTETYSTPVIGSGRVIIGTNNKEPRDPKHQGDRGVLMCFDERDGRLCWQLVVPKRTEDIYLDWPNAGICSPATIEGDRVYIVSNRGEVMALDLHGLANGNDGLFRDEGRHMTPANQPPLEPGPLDADILWVFDLTSGAGIWSHDAAHSSILIRGPHLYLNTGTGVDNTHRRIRTPEAPSLVVLDKRTGTLLARDYESIAPNIFHSTWSSPALAKVGDREEVFFVGGNGIVYAFEPLAIDSGPGSTTPATALSGSSPQATASAGGVASVAHEAGGADAPSAARSVARLQRVWQFDFDPAAPKSEVYRYMGNRRESPSNSYGMPVFHENRLYVAAGGDVFWGKNEAWLKCIDPAGSGDLTKSGEVWSYPLVRHTVSTPAVCDGLVFMADCGQTLHCVDARTGRACWTHELAGEVWASPLVANGKVYLGTRRGQFAVLAAAREKKVLSTLELGTPIHSTAVAANGVLYVTTMTHLYAVK